MTALRQTRTASWSDAWMASRKDPWLFATGVMGYLPHGAPNPDNRDQLEAWQDKYLREFHIGPDGKPTADPRHSIRSGHGTGKTTIIAILALWFVTTHYDAKCVITAASQDQLRDGAWAELRKQSQKLPPDLRDRYEFGEERVSLKAAPEMAFIVRRTASKSNPEALQGVHAKHVLYLVDEASGIDDIIFEVAAGSLSTAGAMACLFSNPTKTNGFFFDTHNRLRDRWRTHVISSEDVPRARGHIQDVIAAYGKGSNRYRVRVMGEFPTKADDTVIPLELVEAAISRPPVERLSVKPVWGVDVARFGDDTSALAKRQGNHLLEPVKEWVGKDTMQLVGLIHDEWTRTDEDMLPAEICVDVIGLGAGVVDRLQEIGLPAHAVNVAESASVDDKYWRLRDELWFRGRDWFVARNCNMPNDPKLVAELTAPTYEFRSSGEIVVEPKSEMKKRGLKSPNKADAFLNTFATLDRKRDPIRRKRYGNGGSAWAA